MGIKGAILGDIIGSKWEFCGCKNPQDVKLFDKDNFFTDDTILSCATKYALDHNITFSDAYKYFGKSYLGYAGAGWGSNFYQWIVGGNHRQSIGNGSAMRVGYLIDYGVGENTIFDLAVKTAQTTHNTDDGIMGATTVAHLGFQAKHGATKDDLLKCADYLYPEYKGWDLDRYRSDYIWSELCRDSIHLAVRCIYESNDFESCMRKVLSVKCDTDTICAIAGSIAEEIYGTPDYADEMLRYYLDDFLSSIVLGE